MSIRRECIVFSYQNLWYYLLENENCPHNPWDWRDYATAYGPFSSEVEARTDRITHQPNPGSEENETYTDPLDPMIAQHLARTPSLWPESQAVRPTLQRAIDTLGTIQPDHPLIAWWKHTGQQNAYRLCTEAIPAWERPILADHLSYILHNLDESIQAEDALDLDLFISRCVSTIEDWQKRYGFRETQYARTLP